MNQKMPKPKKSRGFQIWHVALPVASIATALFFYYFIQTDIMMNTSENPLVALALLMLYANYWGTALLVAIIAWIVVGVSFAIKK